MTLEERLPTHTDTGLGPAKKDYACCELGDDYARIPYASCAPTEIWHNNLSTFWRIYLGAGCNIPETDVLWPVQFTCDDRYDAMRRVDCCLQNKRWLHSWDTKITPASKMCLFWIKATFKCDAVGGWKVHNLAQFHVFFLFFKCNLIEQICHKLFMFVRPMHFSKYLVWFGPGADSVGELFSLTEMRAISQCCSSSTHIEL